MGLSVVFVSGIRRSGKSAVIQFMVDRLWKTPPHYLRIVRAGSEKAAPRNACKPQQQCKVASARWLEYDTERVFEVIAEALTAIHNRDRFGGVIIEADSDPALRHAYPYDYRVFVMPNPAQLSDVFREPAEAAREFRRAMDDTAAFASEMFGLYSESGAEEPQPKEARSRLSTTQMQGFLYSPLGDELATRIQLKPVYHGLVESDAVIINTQDTEPGPETASCLNRIEKLLSRLRERSDHRAHLVQCALGGAEGAERELLRVLKPMCVSGK